MVPWTKLFYVLLSLKHHFEDLLDVLKIFSYNWNVILERPFEPELNDPIEAALKSLQFEISVVKNVLSAFLSLKKEFLYD